MVLNYSFRLMNTFKSKTGYEKTHIHQYAYISANREFGTLTKSFVKNHLICNLVVMNFIEVNIRFIFVSTLDVRTDGRISV